MTRPTRSSGTPSAQPKLRRVSQSQRGMILKALADPHRFELLERIAKAGCPLACAHALAALSISAPTLSHHVKELETAAGLSKSAARVGFALSLPAGPESGKAPRRTLSALRTGRPPSPRKLLSAFTFSFNPFTGTAINSTVVELSNSDN